MAGSAIVPEHTHTCALARTGSLSLIPEPALLICSLSKDLISGVKLYLCDFLYNCYMVQLGEKCYFCMMANMSNFINIK